MVLVGHWPLQEDSGDAIDYVGDNDGGVFGATQGASGPMGYNAYSFDGVDDRVSVGNYSFSANDADQFSLSVWVRVADPTSTDLQWVVRWKVDGNNNLGINYENSQIAYGWSNTNIYRPAPSSPQWDHLVMTVASDGIFRTYRNGVFEDSASVGTATGTDYLFFGQSDIAHRNLEGRMMDVRHYDHALTPEEVQYLYGVSQQASYVSSKKTL